ncbi:MAG: hypothetical protein Q7U53_19910 [Anaerolineaceae bacterium]|nr:hypothetical protein [Anaerolineaceae bacterium]
MKTGTQPAFKVSVAPAQIPPFFKITGNYNGVISQAVDQPVATIFYCL